MASDKVIDDPSRPDPDERRLRLLIVALDVSHPPCDGVSAYVTATIELLRDSGFDVTTVAFTNKDFRCDGEAISGFVHALKSPRDGLPWATARLVRSLWSGLPRSQDHLRSMRRTVEIHVRNSNFDLAIALGNSSAELVRRIALPTLAVQFSPPTTDSLVGSASRLGRFEAMRWQRRIGSSATVLAATTSVDAATIAGMTGREVRVLPLAVRKHSKRAALRSTPSVLFIGDFGYPPNRTGAEILLRDVMPRVWGELPDLELVIAGEQSDTLPDPNDRRVVLYGRYGAVSELASKGTIAVLPILAAAGIRTRVFELAATELPLVVTAGAVEGLEVSTEFVVVPIDGMADAIIDIARSPELRRSLQMGCDVFLDRFRPSSVAELWSFAIREAVHGTSSRRHSG